MLEEAQECNDLDAIALASSNNLLLGIVDRTSFYDLISRKPKICWSLIHNTIEYDQVPCISNCFSRRISMPDSTPTPLFQEPVSRDGRTLGAADVLVVRPTGIALIAVLNILGVLILGFTAFRGY